MAVELHDNRTYSERARGVDEWQSWNNYSGYELQPVASSSQYSDIQVLLRIVKLLQQERTGFGIGHFDPFVTKRSYTTYDDPNDFDMLPPRRRAPAILQVKSVRRGRFRSIEDD
jgi:hypothetical protein